MKNLRTAVLSAGLVICSLVSFSQEKTPPVNKPDYHKPRLFDGLPARIPLNATAISNLFDTPLGRAASISLSEDNRFQFLGDVVSSGANSQQVQSMVIRSTNFNGANFSLSKITQADGTVIYKGRIISFRHGDLYELEHQNGQYLLVKKNFYDLVNE
jgi:hypothetical protein